MRHRVRELLKDLLIILLALSIVALTLLALPARTLTQTPWLASLLAPLTSAKRSNTRSARGWLASSSAK